MFQLFTLLFLLALQLLAAIKILIILYFLSYFLQQTLVRLFVSYLSVDLFLLCQHVHHQLVIVRKRKEDSDVVRPSPECAHQEFFIVVGLDCIVHRRNIRLYTLGWQVAKILLLIAVLSLLVGVGILILKVGIHAY